MVDTIRNLSYCFEESEAKLDLTIDEEELSLKQEIESNYEKIYKQFINSSGKKKQLELQDLTEDEEIPFDGVVDQEEDEITNILSQNIKSQESMKKEIKRK